MNLQYVSKYTIGLYMSIKLTSRQLDVLNLIHSFIKKHGFPPTRAEISAALGFNSLNSAEMHIKALVKKGALISLPGASRGLKINPEFIFNQEDAVLSSTNSDIEDERLNFEDSIASNDLLNLPLVGRVAAGNPIEAIEHHEDQIIINSSVFSQTPDYLLRVRGDSMIDIGIMEGDLLAVKKVQDAQNNEIVVARLDGEVTVKRLHKLKDRIELIPENSSYSVIKVSPEQDFKIEGSAVGLIRNHVLN